METNEIKKIVELVKDTDIDELRWEAGDLMIFLKRSEIDARKVEEKRDALLKSNGTGDKNELWIKSPMVGTFYRAQSSDYPPLVMEGNHVIPGQKVALIEAMKLMKDVISTVKGKIVKVLVENGQPVEYGQKLFQIDQENNEEDGKK